MKPQDLEDLLETHFEIATRLEEMAQLDEDRQPLRFSKKYLNEGRGGLYLMAQKLPPLLSALSIVACQSRRVITVFGPIELIKPIGL